MKERITLICLGIESTAHTFGSGVISRNSEDLLDSSSFKILSDVRDVYKAPMGSGIHPREASRHHAEVPSQVIRESLRQARVGFDDLDCIAYSAGPGLGPCLRVGAAVARMLSSYFEKPLVPTNHAVGHIELGKMTAKLIDPMVLLISGGHTALAASLGDSWKIFGETLDLTLGQLLDQFGRFLGLSSPAGPVIEQLANNGASETTPLDLPYVIKGNDVSYSGLLSAAKRLVQDGRAKESVAHAVQETAFSILVEATERALAFTGKEELLVTGGVAANQRLSSMLASMCGDRGVRLGVIPRHLAGDCGAQIAAAGILFHVKGNVALPREAGIRQSWRLDQVDLTPRN